VAVQKNGRSSSSTSYQPVLEAITMLTGINTVSRIISGYVKFALRWKKAFHLHLPGEIATQDPRQQLARGLDAALSPSGAAGDLKAFISTATSAGETTSGR